jgi:hypothetical protein
LLGNIRTGRNFELEKREQTYTIEGKNYEQDENIKKNESKNRKKEEGNKRRG